MCDFRRDGPWAEPAPLELLQHLWAFREQTRASFVPGSTTVVGKLPMNVEQQVLLGRADSNTGKSSVSSSVSLTKASVTGVRMLVFPRSVLRTSGKLGVIKVKCADSCLLSKLNVLRFQC